MAVPAAQDINVYDSLDERSACKNFLGKSLEEAEALFRENALYFMEDLMWMGPVAFRFYLESAIRYIQSEAATGDSDAINCFVYSLEFRLEHGATELVPVVSRLASVCNYILQNYESFDLAQEIYGDIRARVTTLRDAFVRM